MWPLSKYKNLTRDETVSGCQHFYTKYHFRKYLSPNTTIMLKYRGRDSSEYHLGGAEVPPVVHVPQVENH